jgi:hypothetical protein
MTTLNVLSFNLYMYKGMQKYPEPVNPLIKRIGEIINSHNIDVIFFQEDMEEISMSVTSKFLEKHNFVLAGYCKSENWTVKETGKEKQMINSIYLHKSIDFDYNDIKSQRVDNKCYSGKNSTGDELVSQRCSVTIPVKIDGQKIWLSTSHLCGGRYADQYLNIAEKQFELEKIISSEITIFAADFNTIHPSLFKEEDIPGYLKSKYLEDPTDKRKLNKVKQYMQTGHEFLEKNGLKVAMPATGRKIPTSNFSTVVDYVYYDSKKLDFHETIIVEGLDVSDHNAVVSKFIVKESEDLKNHHNEYKDDFLYFKTMKSLEENFAILEKYVPFFIKYKNLKINDIARRAYNKMYSYIFDADVRGIMDKIFKKMQIPKNTIFYSSFDFRVKFEDFLQSGAYNEDFAINKIKEENDKLDKKSMFQEIFAPFTDKKNKGAIYTTSCFDKDNDTKNPDLSFSGKYLGDGVYASNATLMFKTKENYNLYDLSSSNFKQRILFKRLLTNIFFGGEYLFNISKSDLDNMYKSYNPLFVNFPYSCGIILDNDLYAKDRRTNEYAKFEVDKECISGYWDGENTLHERVINHFLHVYNKKNPNKNIMGYIGRDSGYDSIIGETLYAREIVWFNNEDHLIPIGLYFKNNIIKNVFDFYKTLLEILKNFTDKIVKKEKIKMSKVMLQVLTDQICNIEKNFIESEFDNNFSSYGVTFDDFRQKINDAKYKPISTSLIDIYSQHGGKYYNKYMKYETKYKKIIRK